MKRLARNVAALMLAVLVGALIYIAAYLIAAVLAS